MLKCFLVIKNSLFKEGNSLKNCFSKGIFTNIQGKLKTPTSEHRSNTAHNGAAINSMFCYPTS